MDIAVVILNWNGLKMLQTYLPTLVARTTHPGAFIVVADNGSTDGSLEWMRQEYPAIRTIAFDRNYGFTGGYNRALREIDADYYVLINSDIEVGEGWLQPLVAFMEEHPEVGVCQPKVLSMASRDTFEYAGAAGGYIDRYGYPFCRGRILSYLEKDAGQYDEAEECFWATGACMMVRSALYHHLGGLDESFFAHMEEIDFCWRAQIAGYEVWTVPEAVVWHIGGGTLSPASPLKLKLNYRNSEWMLRKNLPATLGPRKARARIAVRRLIDFATQVAYLLQGKLPYVRAVSEARREAGKRQVVPTEAGAKVALTNVRIIAAWAFRGKKVFDYLRRYESSN